MAKKGTQTPAQARSDAGFRPLNRQTLVWRRYSWRTDAALLTGLTALAASEGRTVADVLNEAAAEYLVRRQKAVTAYAASISPSVEAATTRYASRSIEDL